MENNTIYRKYIKRMLDILCATAALLVFSPLFLILTITGAAAMKGNPFFTQERPGYHERIFKLIKFRTMTENKDAYGTLLSDEKRLTGYGRFLRATSLDELPEAINILKGDMSVVGPRPLLVKYLPYYTDEQHHRHDVRPGLTGNAQAHGRNSISWEDKFTLDLDYVKNLSFLVDVKIIIDTIVTVVKHEGIFQEGHSTMEDFTNYAITKNN